MNITPQQPVNTAFHQPSAGNVEPALNAPGAAKEAWPIPISAGRMAYSAWR